MYNAALEREATVAGPPREHAVPWEADRPRTPALAASAEQGLPAWKQAVGDPRRRLAENGIDRFKPRFGERLASRLFETQVTAVHIRVAALNVMTDLGMPVSVPCRAILS